MRAAVGASSCGSMGSSPHAEKNILPLRSRQLARFRNFPRCMRSTPRLWRHFIVTRRRSRQRRLLLQQSCLRQGRIVLSLRRRCALNCGDGLVSGIILQHAQRNCSSRLQSLCATMHGIWKHGLPIQLPMQMNALSSIRAHRMGRARLLKMQGRRSLILRGRMILQLHGMPQSMQ